MSEIQFEILKGKTLIKIEGGINSEEMSFLTNIGEKYYLFHAQDCYETCVIIDIVGDLNDLLETPILLAEEVVHEQDVNPTGVSTPKGYQDSFTWTFYKLATIIGSVTIRWYGTSNGYYSERVSFALD